MHLKFTLKIMNKIQKAILFFIGFLSVVSCTKDGGAQVQPLRDYATQFITDSTAISVFLDSHYIDVDPDFNVILNPIPEGGTQVSIRNQKIFPLKFKTVLKNDINYKVYYLQLQEGIGQNPTSLDSVFVSYKGTLLDGTQFDSAPQASWLPLDKVITGWSELIPLFKTGNYDAAPSPDPAKFTNFGSGVMFLPSGLGYYNLQPATSVAPYSPLIFSFKLNNLRYRDHDRDKVLTKDEVDVTITGQSPINYDSDADGIPNYLDNDDDNDHYLTKNEILINGVLPSKYADILNCSGNTIGGIKKHLDPNCH